LTVSSKLSFSIAVSPNGWTDGELAAKWIVEDFDRQTRDKANGETRVLILDGHSSHHTEQLLNFALANNIIILGYPPHCTHALQGLDVVCFARMKEEWKLQIMKFEELHKRKVKKGDFVEVFGKAFVNAFTEETVLAAFRATGVFPFNPDIITEQQMKPSLVTSTKAAFPLSQPTPVRRVMAAFSDHHRTAFDVSLDTHTAAQPPAGGSASGPHTPSIPEDASVTMQQTPVHPTPITDSMIDPALFTPSKHSRILVGAMAASKSAAFLVGTSKITSAQTIAPPVLEGPPPVLTPDWSLIKSPSHLQEKSRRGLENEIKALTESLRLAHIHHHAQQSVIEAAHAQLIVQDMFAIKLNEALNVKEKEREKEDDRTKLFPEGKGRHLTDKEFIDQREQVARDKEAQIVARTAKQKARSAKKSRKDALESLWKSRKEEHNKAVGEWTEECQRLTTEGVKKKDLPKKPARPLKSDVEKELVDQEGEEDESDGSGEAEDDEFEG